MRLALPLLITLLGCNAGSAPSDGDGGGDPPITEECEGFKEIEVNDEHTTANFVSLLPNNGYLCGEFLDYDPLIFDKDFYYFFLNPNPGDDEILFNFVVTVEDLVVPAAYLYQTVYDDLGNVEDYIQIGIFYGQQGQLVVLDFPITYDFLDKNDLFLRLDGIYPTDYTSKGYKVEYWTE